MRLQVISEKQLMGSGRQGLNLRPLRPECFACYKGIAVNLVISVRCRTRDFSTRYTERHELHIE